MTDEKKTDMSALKLRLDRGEDPIEALDNIFNGKTVLLVSGGPSAKRWREIYDSENKNGLIVVCVKHSIELVKELCDIHFLNNANLKRYRSHYSALTIITDNGLYVPLFGSYDIYFKVMYEFVGKNQYSLAKKKNFECFTLKNTGLYRPIGPGIIYESVIYTLLHMGVKRIITIGWDIADDNGKNTHFNDRIVKTDETKFYRNLYSKIKNTDFVKKFRLAKFVLSYPFVYTKYFFGKTVNHAVMVPGEAELLSESIVDLKQWLKEKGVNLEIVSDSKWMRG